MGRKTALVCPPLLEDYPPGRWWTTVCLISNIACGWTLTWLCQVIFTYTIGLFLTRRSREHACGLIFRYLTAGTVSYLTPGVRLRRVKGSWPLPRDVIRCERGMLFVSNHRSYMDPFALAAGLLPLDAKYVAKASLFHLPFGGWALHRAGDLAVKFDKNKNQGWGTVKGSVKELLSRSAELLASGMSIALFPEGTRMGVDLDKALEAANHESKLMPFKPVFFDLAKKMHVPVVCVAMCGADDVWPVGSNMMRPAEITFQLSPPLNPDNYSSDVELAEAARLTLGRMYQALCKAD